MDISFYLVNNHIQYLLFRRVEVSKINQFTQREQNTLSFFLNSFTTEWFLGSTSFVHVSVSDFTSLTAFIFLIITYLQFKADDSRVINFVWLTVTGCCAGVASPCLPLVSEHDKLSRWALPFLPHLRTLWPLGCGSFLLCVLIPVLLPFVFQRAWSTVFKGTHVKLPVPLDWLPSLCPPVVSFTSDQCSPVLWSIVQVCLFVVVPQIS